MPPVQLRPSAASLPRALRRLVDPKEDGHGLVSVLSVALTSLRKSKRGLTHPSPSIPPSFQLLPSISRQGTIAVVDKELRDAPILDVDHR